MATNRPPSVEESLADPVQPKIGSRLAKNLHIIIPGVLVALLALVLFTDAAEQDAASGPKSLADQAAAEINETSRLDAAGEQAAIEAELNRQRTAPIPLPDNGLPPVPAVPASLGSAPALPQAPSATPRIDEDARAAELARQKREEEIRSAGLLALGGGGGTAARAGASGTGEATNPADVIRQRLEAQSGKAKQMQEELLGSLRKVSTSQCASAARPRSAGGGGDDNASWLEDLSNGAGQRDVITLDPPGPKPVVHQGAVIPAVLITELNSDLPGQLTAMVTMDIYDTVRGDEMLIPKGSKLVGSYNNSLTAGQERVMAAFTRIIRPDGSSIDLRAMQAADQMGQSGLADEVDNHFVKMFSTSFLIAGLAYLFETNNQPDTVVVTGQSTNGQGLGSEAGKILVDVSRQVLDRYKVIPPTIHIRKGHKFNVVVNRDMAIPAYN